MGADQEPALRFPAVFVNSGQSGAERAALDFALANGIQHSGYTYRGGRVDDGKLSAQYQLNQASSHRDSEVIWLNVNLADATVVFDSGLTQGYRPNTTLTAAACKRLGRPCVIVPSFDDAAQDARIIRPMLVAQRPRVLFVTGDREKKSPGMYKHAMAVLIELIRLLPLKPMAPAPSPPPPVHHPYPRGSL
jgi:hypothetical protein